MLAAEVHRALVEYDMLRRVADHGPDAYAPLESLIRYALIQGRSAAAFQSQLSGVLRAAARGRVGPPPRRYAPLARDLWAVRQRALVISPDPPALP